MSSNSGSPEGKGKGASSSGGLSSRFSNKFAKVINRSFHRGSKSQGRNTFLSPPQPAFNAGSTSSISSSVSAPAAVPEHVQSSNVGSSGQGASLSVAPASTQSTSRPTTPPPATVAPPPLQVTTIDYSDMLWENALKSLSNEDQQILSLKGLEKVEILGNTLDAAKKARDFYVEKQWTFEWKGEKIRVRDVAEKIFLWVEKFKAVGDIIIQYDPGHAALPWGAFRFLLLIAVDDSQKMGALLMGLEKIANLIDRCKIYETLYLGIGLDAAKVLEKDLTTLYASLLKYLALARKTYNKNTAVRILVSVLDTEGLALLQEIEKNESIVFQETQLAEAEFQRSVHRDLHLSNADGIQKLRAILEDLKKPVARVESKVDAILDNLGDETRNQILNWLSKVPYTKHHDTAKEGRTVKTGEWLLRAEKFRHWRNSSTSDILWLHGIPGAGKTKLTSMVVDTFLEEQQQSETEGALAYFYCNDEPQRRDPEAIMAALLKQLSRLRPELPLKGPIVAEYKKIVLRDGSLSGPLGLTRCTELILQLLELYPQTTIVIDALDECDEEKREYLLFALKKLIKESRGVVKIFVSSRDDRDIVQQLEDVPNLYITADDSRGDIEIFVQDEVSKCIKDRKLLKGKVDNELKYHICRVLADGAHGMFLWVALQIKTICKLKIPEDIEEKLGKLPASLTETYSEIYGSISSEEGSGSQLARRAMMWLMCCQRPLSPEEWAAAACFEPATGRKYTVDAEDLLDLCHNLVVLDRQLNVIRFAHLSVEEFFNEHHHESFGIVDRNIMAAECCIHLLCNPDNFATMESGSRRQSNPFLAYSTIHWATHVNIQFNPYCDQQKLKRLGGFLKNFLGSFSKPSPAFLGWLQSSQSTLRAMDSSEWQKIALFEDFQHLIANPPSALPVASFYGLGEIIEAFWDSGSFDINSKNISNESILSLASMAGHEWIVQRLLSKGADINAQGGYYGNALRAAAENGHEGVVRILLDGGAEVNAHSGGFYGNVLQAAAVGGHEGVVKVLLNGGADVHAKGGYHGSALQAAAEIGHMNVAATLLDGGADINAQGGFFGSALQAAAANGHEGLVYLLLDGGAEVNSQGGFYGSALQAAVGCGSQTIVKTLLDSGASVSSPVGFFGCALQMAALAGRKDLFDILLERGADTNYGGGFYGNPLQAAAKNGHGGLVRDLLSRGVPVNSQAGGMCWNALNAAAEGGYAKLVEILLDNGANVNDQGGFYGNALQAAARWGHVEVVKILLDRGASINAQGGSYKNALSAAATYGHPSVVKVLLERGADATLLAGTLSRPILPDTADEIKSLLRDKGIRVEDHWV